MCMRYIAYWGGNNRITFMGDSRIRQLYNSFAKLIATSNDNIGPAYAHHDLSFHDPGNSLQAVSAVAENLIAGLNLDVDFLWAPTINESMFEPYRKWNEGIKPKPKIVVTGEQS